MKTIHLHGILAERFAESYDFEVSSAAEALTALSSQVPGFVEVFQEGRWELISGPISYGVENLTFSIPSELHIYPALEGSKKGGVGKLLLGVGMMALAFSTGGMSLLANGAGMLGGAVGGGMGAAAASEGMLALGGAMKFYGFALALGGVAQLLSPKPKIASSIAEDKHPSMLFTGAIQTTQEGAGVPIALGGPVMCGSHVISGGLYVEEVDLTPTGDVYSPQPDAGAVKILSSLFNAVHFDTVEITGSKGKGGKSAKVAVEAKNTLMTEMTAKIVDLVSVGEVYGWDDPQHPLRCFFMDETPIERDDGTGGNYANFEGLEVHTRLGFPVQDPIPGMDEQASESSVGTVVNFGPSNKIVRLITDETLDAARVKIAFNAMTEQDAKTGDINGSSVEYRVGVRATGWADFSWRVTRTLSEKFTAPLQVAHRIELPAGLGPWEIAVERLTPDSTSVAINNEFSFLSYTRIIDAKMTYPGSAVVGTIAAARQFGDRVPNRAFLWKGIICSVPSNYNPLTRKYTGIWDGTWIRKWTNNGVWVTWEVLTNSDWGFGKYIPQNLMNKWAFYEAAVICDQPVPDGLGGFEPRWTMAAWINTVEEARTFIQTMCSNYLGIMMWGRGAAQISVDSRKKTSRVVNNSNVMDGKFIYEGIGRKAVYTVALVTWNDPNNFFKPAIETVEIPELIAIYGRRPKDVFAFGTTSRGQARRQGLWELYRDFYGNPFVTYKAGLDHAQVLPGEVVEVADVNQQGIRTGGRLKSVSGSSVTLDAPFLFEAGATYILAIALSEPVYDQPVYSRSIDSVGTDYVDLSVAMDSDDRWSGTLTQGATTKTINQVDGGRIYLNSVVGLNPGPVSLKFTSSDGGDIELNVLEFAVTNPAISTDILTVAGTLPSMDEELTLVYALKSDSLETQKFTILSFEETEDCVYEIVALRYTEELFDLIEDGKAFTPRPTTIYDTTIPADPPTNLDLQYRIVMKAGTPKEVIEFTFNKSANALVVRYEIMWRFQNGTWQNGQTQNTSFETTFLGSGLYEWSIIAVPAYGKASTPAISSKVIGEDRLIGLVPITNLGLEGLEVTENLFGGRALRFTWGVAAPEGYTGDDWLDPFFLDFEIKVYKSDNTLLRTFYTKERRAEYTQEMLREDLITSPGGTGIVRNIKISVRLRDQQGSTHPSSTRVFTNPSPEIPNITVRPTLSGATLTIDPVEDLDVSYLAIWVSDTNVVTPDLSPEVYTLQSSVEITAEPGQTKFFRYAQTDDWARDVLDSNISSVHTFSAAIVPGLADALIDIQETMNSAIALTNAQLAQLLRERGIQDKMNLIGFVSPDGKAFALNETVVKLTDGMSFAQFKEALSASFDGLTASIGLILEVSADPTNAYATASLISDVQGRLTAIKTHNNGHIGQIIFVSDEIHFQDPDDIDGSTAVEMLSYVGGRWTLSGEVYIQKLIAGSVETAGMVDHAVSDIMSSNYSVLTSGSGSFATLPGEHVFILDYPAKLVISASMAFIDGGGNGPSYHHSEIQIVVNGTPLPVRVEDGALSIQTLILIRTVDVLPGEITVALQVKTKPDDGYNVGNLITQWFLK